MYLVSQISSHAGKNQIDLASQTDFVNLRNTIYLLASQFPKINSILFLYATLFFVLIRWKNWVLEEELNIRDPTGVVTNEPSPNPRRQNGKFTFVSIHTRVYTEKWLLFFVIFSLAVDFFYRHVSGVFGLLKIAKCFGVSWGTGSGNTRHLRMMHWCFYCLQIPSTNLRNVYVFTFNSFYKISHFFPNLITSTSIKTRPWNDAAIFVLSQHCIVWQRKKVQHSKSLKHPLARNISNG